MRKRPRCRFETVMAVNYQHRSIAARAAYENEGLVKLHHASIDCNLLWDISLHRVSGDPGLLHRLRGQHRSAAKRRSRDPRTAGPGTTDQPAIAHCVCGTTQFDGPTCIQKVVDAAGAVFDRAQRLRNAGKRGAPAALLAVADNAGHRLGREIACGPSVAMGVVLARLDDDDLLFVHG